MLFQGETLTVEKDRDGSAFLKIDVPGRPVNVLTRQLLRDLGEALSRLELEKTLPLLTIRSGKNTGFLAGADLREFLDLRDAAAARDLARQGQELFARLAKLPCPTIVAISGACLGGGLELALACDYRLVLDRPGTLLGLPEVELGLLPAWGGTQRLPHIVGLEHALLMILSGKRLSAVEAYRWGLADVLARTEGELRAKFAELTRFAITQGKRQLRRPTRRSWRQWLLESTRIGRRVLLRASERVLRKKVPDDMPAPLEAFAAISAGAVETAEKGFEAERDGAGRLAVSVPCRRLIGLFFAREAARKLPAELAKADNTTVQRVGIVGAGVLGAGLAQLAAIKGAEVIVQEASVEALGAGLLRVQQLFQQALERGIVSPDEGLKRLAAIKGVLDWKGFEDVQLVVEATPENLETKSHIFRELETRTRADCVLATATSSLRVGDIAAAVSRPERVAGLHCFHPLHKVPLAEVVSTPHAAPATLARLMNWSIALGKTPVRVNDSPGFVVLRVLLPYLNEAALLVREGLPITVIDDEMRRFGMTIGPLEALDALGLDTLAALARARGTPSEALDLMLANEWLGQRTGRGFYTHGGKKLKYNHLAENLLRQGHLASAMRGLSLAARRADARDRLVLLMVKEAAQCVAEGLTATPGEVDLALILGHGWAMHRGGPLHHADDLGLALVVEKLRGLERRLGPRFAPNEELVLRAEQGRQFCGEGPRLSQEAGSSILPG
jgi:3-hydroxyacyl-CoA dehydrogenase/enoyl-CoA hydratase/3-hydroxybutyryl-CoA epimerase